MDRKTMGTDFRFFIAAYFVLLQWSPASAADVSFHALNGQSWRCYYDGDPSRGGKPCASNSVKRLNAKVGAAGVTFIDDKGQSALAPPSYAGDKNLYFASWDCSVNIRDGLGEGATTGGLDNPIVLYFYHGDRCALKDQLWISTKLSKKELKRLEKAAITW